MINKEVLRRLKDANIATLEHYYYGQKVIRVELNGEKYKELIEDLEKDAQYDEYMKTALNSVYGVGWYDKLYAELADKFARENIILKKDAENILGHNAPKVMFDGPYTIFQWGDFITVVKCDEEDEFDVDIGLGIALYRYYRQNADTRKQFNKLAEYMFLSQLADYALDYFCGFSKKKRSRLFNNNPVEGGWYRLDK